MSRRFLALAAALVVLAPGAADARTVVDAGHVDLSPRLLDGGLRMQLRADEGGRSVWRELDAVVLHVTDKARLRVPDDPRFDFLGAAGRQVWLMPELQDRAVVWPGWSVRDRKLVRRLRGPVTWRLRAVRGPGRFALFSGDGFGRTRVLFDAARRMPQQIAIPAGTHAHANWSFSRAGAYRLDIEMEGTIGQGRKVADRGVLRVFVGDGEPQRPFADRARSVARRGDSPPWAALGIAAVAVAAAGEGARRRRRGT